MSKQVIVAIVGMPGAGKSTTADYFRDLGYETVYFGGIVVDTVKERGLEINEKNERAVREGLRADEGMAVMAVRSLPKIDKILESGKNVVIDDLYSFDEYKVIHEKYGDKLHVVAVVAPRPERYKRLAKRPHRPLNEEEAYSRDFSQIENLSIGGSIAIADHYLYNDSSVEEHIKNTQKLADSLI